MSAVEFIPQANGEDSGGLEGEDFCVHSNPDSLEDIPATMVRSEELPASSKTDVFFDRMLQSSSSSTRGSPAKSSSAAIRRAASVTGATTEDYKEFAVASHMSPTISSRRRCVTDSTSMVIITKRKGSKDKEKEKEKDSISLPCTMTRPTPRENRACRKRIELSHRNHLDFPHEHYHDDPHHHHHHSHHHPHKHNDHSHGNNGHSHGNGNNHSNNTSTSSNSSSGSVGGGAASAGLATATHSHSNNSHHSNNNSNHSHSTPSHSSSHPGSHSTSSLTGGTTSSSRHGYASEVSAEEYLTPLQRKDQVIRGLKEELKKTQRRLTDLNGQMEGIRQTNSGMEEVIAQKESEIERIKEEKNQEIGRMQERMMNTMTERSVDEQELREKILELNELIQSRDKQAERSLADKRHEILELREKVEELEFNYDELVHVYEESVINTKAMEKELLALKEELERREDEHQDMYLAMFQKGKQCHNFERQEELENLGRSDPNTVMVDELIEKLENTESKLGRWQTIKTCEIYSESVNRPESEADARLRFLRDSLFHYITDPNNAMQHLRAMAGIVDFTHAQREQVDRVLVQREKGMVKGVKEKLTEKKKVVQFVFKEKREEVMDKIREHRSRRNSHH